MVSFQDVSGIKDFVLDFQRDPPNSILNLARAKGSIEDQTRPLLEALAKRREGVKFDQVTSAMISSNATYLERLATDLRNTSEKFSGLAQLINSAFRNCDASGNRKLRSPEDIVKDSQISNDAIGNMIVYNDHDCTRLKDNSLLDQDGTLSPSSLIKLSRHFAMQANYRSDGIEKLEQILFRYAIDEDQSNIGTLWSKRTSRVLSPKVESLGNDEFVGKIQQDRKDYEAGLELIRDNDRLNALNKEEPSLLKDIYDNRNWYADQLLTDSLFLTRENLIYDEVSFFDGILRELNGLRKIVKFHKAQIIETN